MYDWRFDAECRDAPDPELFFPIGKSGPALDAREEAFDVCARCPVASLCLADALEVVQPTDGIFGGYDFAPEREHLPRSGAALLRQGKRMAATG
jgi:WhiB family redox-sensing transcriptional regulator